MNISVNDVKELRERTGAGMMECKKALVEASGNIEIAIETMRKAGTARAAKKAGRIAAEGLIVVKINEDKPFSIILEVNCETDFVSRDTHFKAFVEFVAQTALDHGVTSVEKLPPAVEEARQALINQVGENVQIRRMATLGSLGTIAAYVHHGRIGALVALSIENKELAKDLAMHIAAANPQYIKPEEVPCDVTQREKEIFIAQSVDSGKPSDIVEKMVMGRINKFVNEISLIGQPFVKDPNQSVGQLLNAAKAEVLSFVRFEVGEGIEKVTEDFATAVMAQAGVGAA